LFRARKEESAILHEGEGKGTEGDDRDRGYKVQLEKKRSPAAWYSKGRQRD